MKLKDAVISLALAVGLGASGWWWFIYKPQQQELALIQEVEQRVKEKLNDPDSAKFRNVTYYTKSRAGCGEVNAKNRMGGYVGYTVFIAFEDGDVRFAPGRDQIFSSADSPLEVSAKLNNFSTLVLANCV